MRKHSLTYNSDVEKFSNIEYLSLNFCLEMDKVSSICFTVKDIKINHYQVI